MTPPMTHPPAPEDASWNSFCLSSRWRWPRESPRVSGFRDHQTRPLDLRAPGSVEEDRSKAAA